MTTKIPTPFKRVDGVVHSLCSPPCGDPITITANPRFDTASWIHDELKVRDHEAVPEFRTCIDATCPGCGNAEIGFAPDRSVFTCSRCGWTGTERPAS